MTTKIQIKFGSIEVNYEGPEEFLKEELPQLLTKIAGLHKQSDISDLSAKHAKPDLGGSNTPKLQATTGAIAAKLSSKSGPDLVVAAAARFTFVVGKETFGRKELLTEMKTATAYYKSSYGGNLSKHLNGLVKEGVLLEPSTQTYSLSADKKLELGKQLA